MRMRVRILLLTALILSAAAAFADRTPLLMEGKQSLYQRVLAVPGATLHFQPAEQQTGTPITPFTAFYVYERRQSDNGEWLRIGTDRYGDVVGWLRADRSLTWNQGLTVSFRDPIGHDRALLFRDDSTLRQLIEQRDMEGYSRLYEAAEAGKLPDDSPVVAMQPPGFVDIREDFYLVPILDHEDVYLGSEQARMLKVSSVPLTELPTAPRPAGEAVADTDTTPAAGSMTRVAMTLDTEKAAVTGAKPSGETRPSRGYTAGLVFVIDSTLSMDPYIDRTREAVTKIYDSLADADLLGHVNFGLVAYRDNLRAAPGLDYLARTYVTLEQGRDPGSFLKRVKSLRASKVSSRHFREDAYSGVNQAIEDIDWQGTDARYLVLITDAGAREPTDPLAGTGLSAQSLHQLAQDKGIANFVLHLLTPSRFADHEIAEQQYRTLSQYPGIGDLYYGVKTGNVEEFGQVLDALAGQITRQVQAAVADSMPSVPDAKPVIAAAPAPAPEAAANPQLAALQEKVAKLGYALRLRYLNRTGNHGAPTVFEAWVLDRDFREPERRALDIRVLLTRDQLSDLSDILKQVLEQAEEGLLSPQNFLDELKSLAATLTRDPERLGSTTATTAGAGNSLSQLGFMREYIDDLPYTGEVMNLSLDDWQSWPAQRQIAFLNRLEEKISYYRALHDHTDLWVSLDGGPIDGDSVYPIALEQLP